MVVVVTMSSIFKRVFLIGLTLFSFHSYSGIIIYSDLQAFEDAAAALLDFEDFSDSDLEGVTVEAGDKRFRYHSSMVTEGDTALYLENVLR